MSEHPDHPSLSEDEVAAIRKKARAKLNADKKKDEETRLFEAELRRLKMEEGLVVGGAMDDMVDITIDLAEFATCLTLDSVAFHHGRTYTVPRHRADTLREMMYRGWEHQNEIDGKSRKSFYAKNRMAKFSEVRGQFVGEPK